MQDEIRSQTFTCIEDALAQWSLQKIDELAIVVSIPANNYNKVHAFYNS